jgi:hypothetical protein
MDAVAIGVLVGVDVSDGGSASVGGDDSVDVNAMATVAVALGMDSGMSVAPSVAVTIRISGEGQLH